MGMVVMLPLHRGRAKRMSRQRVDMLSPAKGRPGSGRSLGRIFGYKMFGRGLYPAKNGPADCAHPAGQNEYKHG